MRLGFQETWDPTPEAYRQHICNGNLLPPGIPGAANTKNTGLRNFETGISHLDTERETFSRALKYEVGKDQFRTK